MTILTIIGAITSLGVIALTLATLFDPEWKEAKRQFDLE